jgi:hypothetical protein
MQLDRTKIPIRERGIGDILDLSLQVIRNEFGGLLLCLGCLAIPLAVLNAWLTRALIAPVDETSLLFRYVVANACLVVIEVPFGTVLMVIYLGEVLFLGDKRLPRIFFESPHVWWRFLYFIGIRRGILVAWVIAAYIPRSFGVSTPEGFLIALTGLAVLMRLARPYLCEIILLERAPLSSRQPNAVTVSRRSRSLHSVGTSESVSRYLLCMVVSIAILGSLLGTVHFLMGTLSFDWERGAFFYRVVVPLIMWIVAGFMTVVRFLSYLDQRIRNEGWEVELLIKAACDDLRNGARASHA